MKSVIGHIEGILKESNGEDLGFKWVFSPWEGEANLICRTMYLLRLYGWKTAGERQKTIFNF